MDHELEHEITAFALLIALAVSLVAWVAWDE